mmetsp:Transcript_42341/g.131930  ORF Transcript_42341/g.131930 Transcript_42341/m.131930 type:complete len:223 (-) Transcript_42341:403-1071(-)
MPMKMYSSFSNVTSYCPKASAECCMWAHEMRYHKPTPRSTKTMILMAKSMKGCTSKLGMSVMQSAASFRLSRALFTTPQLQQAKQIKIRASPQAAAPTAKSCWGLPVVMSGTSSTWRTPASVSCLRSCEPYNRTPPMAPRTRTTEKMEPQKMQKAQVSRKKRKRKPRRIAAPATMAIAFQLLKTSETLRICLSCGLLMASSSSKASEGSFGRQRMPASGLVS